MKCFDAGADAVAKIGIGVGKDEPAAIGVIYPDEPRRFKRTAFAANDGLARSDAAW